MFTVSNVTVFPQHTLLSLSLTHTHSTELSPHEDTILCNGDLILLVPDEEDCVVRVEIDASNESSLSLSKQRSPTQKHLASAKKRKQEDINSVLMGHARSNRAMS